MADVSHLQSNVNNVEAIETITNREFVLLLISLYRECPELWKVKLRDYTNKTKRYLALQKILSVLRKYRPDYDEDKLKKKINILRTNFNKECQKINRRQLHGGSGDDAEPTLWYYNDMIFVKDQTAVDGSEICEQTLVEELIPTPPPPLVPFGNVSGPPSSPPVENTIHSKRKRTITTPSEELIDLPTPSYFKRPEYEADILAKGWALKLSRLAPEQRLFAEKIINDTLFEAEMGTLTRNGVIFLTSPVPIKPPPPDECG